MSFQWQSDVPRVSVADLKGMCRNTGALISGPEYWVQCFEMALALPPGTWFANMEGGSHISELYDTLHGSTWFGALVTCEIIRLACIPMPARLGGHSETYPQIPFVRRIYEVRVPDAELHDGRLTVEIEADLEGHGHWTGALSLFIYDPETLRAERAKGQWMSENMRRIENGEYALPSLGPPEGWDPEDGFPD